MLLRKSRRTKKMSNRGRLRIGDDWNAITIIALSQSSPLKAIAEFVENSIDAQASRITIIRGKERKKHYLKIIDNGHGVPCTEEGTPDFKYVATHICDSIKRHLKQEGAKHIQGEFGIGLLSFWTVGDKLTMINSGKDGKTYLMEMEKGKSSYTISCHYRLAPVNGTQLTISSLLPGVRSLNGEKIQRYLASELRDRIRNSGTKIKILDRTNRSEFDVEPRQYSGQLLHSFPSVTTVFGDIYVELYLREHSSENCVSLFRSGTRVLPTITALDAFQSEPWMTGYFQGIIDAPFLNLTPGTRSGIIQDERFAAFCEALVPLRERLTEIMNEQIQAEEERMSRNILRSVQKAIREAILVLPPEEYDWFSLHEYAQHKDKNSVSEKNSSISDNDKAMIIGKETRDNVIEKRQKQFFEFSGPLFSAKIQPASALVPVSGTRSFCALGLDRRKRQIEENLSFVWEIVEGQGCLDKTNGEMIVFHAPKEPGLTRLKVTICQAEQICEAESTITIVDSLVKSSTENSGLSMKGLPGYTLESFSGQSWRSRYDEKRNLIVINNSHRDFVYATKQKSRKLRYICRLFAKELIYFNFPGKPADQLLERMAELLLYIEDNLK